ncbi:hypothetical protein [Chelativorans sp. M5D2P16]|uniref:hypothetical protein n=1 Tax=Chelativorans sp. M5D2P16 TaxID=3095678 RepID=UPI002ACA990A|nr:hypothetical protein [Chelativorans sp. M5D2P16]MDZ5697240.1 hypothetical protein [Chelativorans sp. M5D2P16]
MRFVLRLLSMLSLAVAVIMAVVDATRTVAVEALTFTPLGESWRAVSPETYRSVGDAVIDVHPWLWDPVATAILSLPGWAVFAALALVFYAAGHRRPRHGTYASIPR